MKNKRKPILITLSILLLAFSIAELYFFRSWIRVNPFQPFALTEVVGACKDHDGNLFVIDSAGERLLKASADGTLLWQIKSSDESFRKAVRLCTDDAGNVYVQDKRIRSGIRLESEQVLMFSSDGSLLKTVSGREAAEDQIRPSITSLFRSGEGASVVFAMDNGLTLRSITSSDTKFFPMEHADDLVLNAVWDSTEASLWYCTFNGRIYHYIDGKQDELVYDNSRHIEEIESVPRAISYLDGTLYAADRGLRCLISIDVASGEPAFHKEDTDWAQREVCDSVNSDFSVVSTTESLVKIWDQDTCESIDTLSLSSKYIFIACMTWACLVILAVILILDLLFLIYFLFQKASSMVRIVAAVLIGVGALATMLVATLFPNFTEQMYRTMYDKADYCASLTMERMPLSAFLNLDESSDYLGKDYLAVQSAVNSVFKTESNSVNDLYCTMYRVLGDHDTITLTYSMDENSMLFPYDWEYEDSEEQSIMTTRVGKEFVNRSQEGSYLFVLDPILDENGNSVGLIEVGTDLQSFEEEMQRIFFDLLLNLIAVTAVGVMFLIEIIYFLRGRNEYHLQLQKPEDGASVVRLPAGMLRGIVFLVFFFTNLTTAVLPTYAIKLASDVRIPGLSAAFMSAVPFSAEVISGALFSVFGAGLIRRLSLKRASLLCAVLFSAGLALRIIPSYWMITLGSLVIGIGWGVILLIVNVLIADMPGDSKDTGFAYYNAAALNGINSGTVFGGFLLNWLPTSVLFVLTAVGSLLLLLVVGKYLVKSSYPQEDAAQEEAAPGSGSSTGENASRMSWIQFLGSWNILSFFLMLVVPVLIGSYFLIYLYPIIGTRWGLSETYVGYSFLLNGLCVMSLSTLMTNLFTKINKKRFGLTLSALLYALAFALVAFFHSIPALLFTLILLGFSDSFGLPLQTSFYTDQKEVQRFGFDRSLGVYSLFENISQSLGPFVFSWALVAGVSKGLSVIAAVIAVLAVAFLFVGIFVRRAKSSKLQDP